MKRLIIASLAIALQTGLAALAAAAPAGTTSLIVRFDESGAKARLPLALRVARLAEDAGFAFTYRRPMALGAHLLALPNALSTADAQALADRLSAHPDIAFAQPDARRHALRSANDEFLSGQGYLDNRSASISAFAAWDTTTGSPATVVAVLDTGYRPHADMAGRNLPGYDFVADPLVANDGDGRDSDAQDPGDWVSAADRALPAFADCAVEGSRWHGTAVAGVIGANTNNGQWTAGINWSTRILPVRVLGKCGGRDSDIIDAVAWAGGLAVPGVPANPNPAQVINLSLGGRGACGPGYRSVFSAVLAAGHTRAVIAAAGNDGEDAAAHAPANCPEVISVASTNASGRLVAYSNFGPGITLSAPGGQYGPGLASQGIIVLSNAGTTTPALDAFGVVGGTSFAAPMVSGVASLMLALAPQLSPAELRSMLLSTAKPFPAGSNCSSANCGAGIVDAEAAVLAAKAATPVDPTTVGLVEYFHAAFGHYFVTANTDEIAKLDDGTLAGWARTGYRFRVFAAPRTGTMPVCRFFTVAFPPKSSHFYTLDPVECAGLKTNPDWTFEAEVFYAGVPAGGTCTAGLLPVFRLYNDGQTGAPNHRFTIDPVLRDTMVAQKYILEGVGFCAAP